MYMICMTYSYEDSGSLYNSLLKTPPLTDVYAALGGDELKHIVYYI